MILKYVDARNADFVVDTMLIGQLPTCTRATYIYDLQHAAVDDEKKCYLSSGGGARIMPPERAGKLSC